MRCNGGKSRTDNSNVDHRVKMLSFNGQNVVFQASQALLERCYLVPLLSRRRLLVQQHPVPRHVGFEPSKGREERTFKDKTKVFDRSRDFF